MWLLNVLLTSRSTCVISLEETRASSFISCGKTGEQGHTTTHNHDRDTDSDLSRAAMLGREPWGHHGSGSAETSCLSLGGRGRRECPPSPWDLCEGLSQAVVGGEVTEGQPGV